MHLELFDLYDNSSHANHRDNLILMLDSTVITPMKPLIGVQIQYIGIE